MEQPVALAHVAIHDTVVRILRNANRGSLLDVPAGEGALAKRLIDLGYKVACCDLYPQIFKLRGVEVVQGNLDGKLPFGDGSFDYIVCVEGLEHIENPANAIREFSRVTNISGTLIISVPNIMNIEERLKWLFSGYTSHFKPISAEARAAITEQFAEMEEVALHVNPIGYSEIRYLLEKYGFAVENLFADKPKENSWAYAPLVALVRLAARASSADKRKSRWTNELNSREVLTGGNSLIFLARKL